ncbi:uncharacterized protein [Castor canadensis]|uniref:Uncharacterized protein n=1 Tax=Castor canadensis TaxID=51338 RepID=A0AC58L2X9_CASCN
MLPTQEGRPPPAGPSHPSLVHLLQPNHPSLSAPLLAHRRPCHCPFGDFMPGFLDAPGRRYRLKLGMLTPCGISHPQGARLCAGNCRMVCNPATKQICPSSNNQRPPPVPRQMVCWTLASRERNAQEPSVKETTVNALKGSNKGIVQKEGAGQMTNSTLASPARNAQQPGAKDATLKETMQSRVEEESQILRDGKKSKRKCHESSGSSPSTSEPLLADGSSASLVQKPVPLKRSLASETSDDPLNKRARMCSRCSPPSKFTCGIPVPKRNAIMSSYSSTGGVSQLWKRRGHTSALLSGPASSHCQQPGRTAKNKREEGLGHGSSTTAPTPQVMDKESHGQRATDDTTRKEKKSSMSLPTPGSSGSRKRKRCGDPLTCPLPPLLAYPITPEVHREKKARFQWFSKALEDKTVVASNCVTKEPCLTFTLPAIGPASLPSSHPTPAPGPGATPLLASLKTAEIPDCTPSLPAPADVVSTTTPAPGPGATPLLASPKTMPNPDCAVSLPGPAVVVSTGTPAPAKPPGHTLTLTAERPASCPASVPTSGLSTIPLVGHLKKMKNLQAPPSFPVVVGVVTTVAPAPPKTTGLPAVLSSSHSVTFAGTSSAASTTALVTGPPMITSSATLTTTGPASRSSSKPMSGLGVKSVASTTSTTTSTTTTSTTASTTTLTSQGIHLGASAPSGAHNPVAPSSFQIPQPSTLSTSAPPTSFGQPLPSTNPSTPGISGLNHPLTTVTSLGTLRVGDTTNPSSNTHPVPPPYTGPKSQPTNGGSKKQKKRVKMSALIKAFAALSLADSVPLQAHKQQSQPKLDKSMRSLVAKFSKLSFV